MSNRLFWLAVGLYGLCLVWVWWLGGGGIPQSFWGKSIVPVAEQRLPPEFPLWFSLPRGEEQLAVMGDLWLTSLGLGGLIFLDLSLSILLMRKMRILAYTVLWTAILTVGMWGFGVLRVYLLVG